MGGMIDLTEAWLEWKKTCAVDLCSQEHRNNLVRVAQSTINRKIRTLNKDQVTDWTDYCDIQSPVSVFHELEVMLYLKKEIHGRPFKDYLFEAIGTRTGGVGKNLTGYLIKTMLTRMFYKNVTKNFRRSNDNDNGTPHTREEQNEDVAAPSDNDPFMLDTDDPQFISDTGRKMVIDIVAKQWDEDLKLGFFCRAHHLPLTNPVVKPFFRRRKTALADALAKAEQDLKQALSSLDITDPRDHKLVSTLIVNPFLDLFISSRKEKYETIINCLNRGKNNNPSQ